MKRRTKHWMHERWGEALDLLYPRRCQLSGELLAEPGSSHFSEACWQEGFERIEAPRCPQCGQPFDGAVADLTRPCARCRRDRFRFEEGRALLRFNEAARTLVHRLKSSQGRFLEEDLLRLIREDNDFCDYLAGATLVPVPLHPWRQLGRGYNQAAYLAGLFARCAQDCELAPLLVRRRHTISQTALRRAERQRNLRAGFRLRRKQALPPEKRYLLVDDVLTTGSTLDATAAVLRRAGAQKVGIAVLTLVPTHG